jgi:hypothetical protein
MILISMIASLASDGWASPSWRLIENRSYFVYGRGSSSQVLTSFSFTALITAFPFCSSSVIYQPSLVISC